MICISKRLQGTKDNAWPEKERSRAEESDHGGQKMNRECVRR